MKKGIVVGLMMFGVLVLTGCGVKTNNVLECSITQDQDQMVATQTLKAVFEENEVVNMEINTDFKLDDEIASSTEDLKDNILNAYKEKYGKDGVDITVTNDENTVYTVIKMDFKAMSDEDKEELNVVDTRGSVNATKKDLQDSGYNCK